MRVIFLKLEVPADDDVRHDVVKAAVEAAIRSLGRKENFGAAGEGQGTTERAVLFDAARVKTWQPERKRKGKADG